MNVPEGVDTVTVEGRDLKLAIAGAAEQLGLDPGQVDYKLDLSHFRNAAGVSLARTTVRIIAWGSGRTTRTASTNGAGAKPARERKPARPVAAEVEASPAVEAEAEAAPSEVEASEKPRRSPKAKKPKAVEASEAVAAEVPAVEGRVSERKATERKATERKASDRDDSDRDDSDADSDSDSDREPAPPARAARAPAPRAPARADVPARTGAGPSKPDALRGAEAGSTKASAFAQTWFEALLGLMSVDGTVTGTGSDDRVHLSIKAERAGRIVGKRGATLGSIRHLLDLALEHRFGKLIIDVDVGDDRPPQEREARGRDRGDRERSDRGDRGDRGDRERSADRGDRERSADRGDRGGDRGRDRDRRDRDRGGDRGDRGDRGGDRGDRGDRGARSKYPEAKLRALAQRAAEKALESGKTITINLELNSFDRRIVHVEVSRLDGVESQSEERTDDSGRVVKYIQIIPLLT